MEEKLHLTEWKGLKFSTLSKKYCMIHGLVWVMSSNSALDNSKSCSSDIYFHIKI